MSAANIVIVMVSLHLQSTHIKHLKLLHMSFQTVKNGASEFQATSMDDLLAHLKAIHDTGCAFPKMSYMDYMAQQYTYGQQQKKGLHNVPNEFATEVLERYCSALINLFNGRPFAKTDLDRLKPAAVNDFKHIIQGLLALDDADWRPVALVAMVKADKSRKKGVKVTNHVRSDALHDIMP